MGKLGEALEAGQMSTDSRAKIYNNMAHYHNTRGEYQAAITASLQALEAQPSILRRPYLRLAENHRLLGNPCMAVLALRKGQGLPGASSCTKNYFNLALREFSAETRSEVFGAETRSEVEQYVRREARGRSGCVDLLSAMDARYEQGKMEGAGKEVENEAAG
mgnify:CR=1 FL=1